jgi:hypothetical protein
VLLKEAWETLCWDTIPGTELLSIAACLPARGRGLMFRNNGAL